MTSVINLSSVSERSLACLHTALAHSASLPPLTSWVSTGTRPRQQHPGALGEPAIHGQVRKLPSFSSTQGREVNQPHRVRMLARAMGCWCYRASPARCPQTWGPLKAVLVRSSSVGEKHKHILSLPETRVTRLSTLRRWAQCFF